MLADERSVAGPPATIRFDLGEGCTTTVPLRDTLARTTISSTVPVHLHGYPRKVAAKVLLYIRTGGTSLTGLTLQELGYLIYLADSLGVYGIIDAIQKKYDEFKPVKTDDDYKEAIELLNISTLVASIDADKMARNISFDYLVSNSHLVESVWSPSMVLLISQLSQEAATQEEELATQLGIFKVILHWANHVQPTESILSQILNTVPGLNKICQSFPHPLNRNYVLNEEIEEIYFGKILGNRYETVWNQWLETKFDMAGEPRMAEMGLEPGNIRARYLPDHLFENARSNDLAVSRPPAQDDFDWSAYYNEEEMAEARDMTHYRLGETNPPNVLTPWQEPKPRKMTLLKNALKTPFIQLKNRLMNRNNR